MRYPPRHFRCFLWAVADAFHSYLAATAACDELLIVPISYEVSQEPGM